MRGNSPAVNHGAYSRYSFLTGLSSRDISLQCVPTASRLATERVLCYPEIMSTVSFQGSSGRNFREHGVKQPSLPGRRLAVAHYFRDHGQAAVNRESRRIQQLLVLYKTNLSSRGMSLQQATAKSLVLPLKSEFSSKAKLPRISGRSFITERENNSTPEK